ncbi:MAG TPA: cell envelope integrity protein CreD [Vicinamibacterales bacterium]|nr:cell envelope integrity protein CreD [Vicinamibacterales bacterium]
MLRSPMARLVVMIILMVGLMVPLLMIYALVYDRTTMRSQAAETFQREWGGTQTLAGPVLTIPYRHAWRDAQGVAHEKTERFFLLPESVAFEGTVEPEVRARGIFEIVVYTARLKVTGRFPKPDLSQTRPSPTIVDWAAATVDIGISDPRGIARGIVIAIDGRAVQARPGVTPNGIFPVGVRGFLQDISADADPLAFEFEIHVKGTQALLFLPGGDETVVTLASSWPHPSFVGGPRERTSTGAGFTASWQVPFFGRGFPSQWTTADLSANEGHVRASTTTFGVTLIRPVDVYLQTERAVKYAALFIVLTFVTAFLWEVAGRALVHPIQYTFVGFALCLFYLLLLSLAEHIGFDRAYALAAGGTIGLVSWYWTWVLNGASRGTVMGGVLAGLYGFLYLLLRLEDYALLAGSIGLFVVLALVMFMTRRVDWYNLKLGTQE